MGQYYRPRSDEETAALGDMARAHGLRYGLFLLFPLSFFWSFPPRPPLGTLADLLRLLLISVLFCLWTSGVFTCVALNNSLPISGPHVPHW